MGVVRVKENPKATPQIGIDIVPNLLYTAYFTVALFVSLTVFVDL